jgi:dephospho-CoA kinase
MARRKIKIAVTGGIGSGKSEVCRIISDAGYDVIHADDIAKDILKSDAEVRDKVIALFGDQAYLVDDINRDYLSSVVFNDPENVAKINGVIHPVTLLEINKQIDKVFKSKDIVFVESALIFEAGREDNYDYILLVLTDEAKRIERILAKGKLSPVEITGRMKNQLPDEVKSKNADFIVQNNDGLDELAEKIKFYINLFETLAEQNN